MILIKSTLSKMSQNKEECCDIHPHADEAELLTHFWKSVWLRRPFRAEHLHRKRSKEFMCSDYRIHCVYEYTNQINSTWKPERFYSCTLRLKNNIWGYIHFRAWEHTDRRQTDVPFSRQNCTLDWVSYCEPRYTSLILMITPRHGRPMNRGLVPDMGSDIDLRSTRLWGTGVKWPGREIEHFLIVSRCQACRLIFTFRCVHGVVLKHRGNFTLSLIASTLLLLDFKTDFRKLYPM
jgi:hypothetical protein